ncbi:Hsp70 family protein [Streptomyces sp. NPDC059009]|uniref:Hsp70 family protein n=1 Tax=Streptomyces sp. NPDC059009 TaxID=3346694 RepID=UPI0036C87C86
MSSAAPHDDALHRVVGIDLGTTYSAVAAYRPDDSAPEIVADPELAGVRAAAAPSVVRIDAVTGRFMVGHPAKDAITAREAAGETIIEIKREMGEVFTEDSLARFEAAGTYAENDPVHVRLHGEWLRPQEVSALILMHMKRIAERGLGGEIHDAVITVPAYFTERQKKATEEAALLAGLHPRQLIPEPTAAAIAYGVDQASDEREVFLVFDLGGGTFDVSIIETRENQIEVIATAGDQRLGGGDFDEAVVEWIRGKTAKEPATPDEHLRWRAAAEAAKRELSLRGTATVDLADGTEPFDLDRATFESLIQPILARSLQQVEEALRFAGEDKEVHRDDVNAVLLVGGSTRIPRVRQMLLDYFDRDDAFVRADANPDTLVARGAAVVAHRFEPSVGFDLSSRPTAEREDDGDGFSITLITEHTLGVGVQDGRSDALIKRGTKIPAREVKRYTNPPQARHIEVNIYQGEAPVVYENTLVGTIVLDEMEPQPEGYHQFDLSFALDVNGLLQVKVMHVNVNREYHATFQQSTSIGKVDRMAESRTRLLRLYGPEPDTGRRSPGGGDTWAPDPDGPAIPGAVPPPVGAVGTGLRVDPDDVPAEFRRLFRKVGDWVSVGPVPAELTAALNEFEAAVRLGLPVAELESLADRLEDAYDSARR